MWTTKNRGRYDRSHLRYPSDLTDDEWALVGAFIRPAKRGGNRRHVDVREVMNGIMYVLSTGCQWQRFRRICRRCFTILICGAGMERSIVSITRSMWGAGSRMNGKPAQPPPSSIAKA